MSSRTGTDAKRSVDRRVGRLKGTGSRGRCCGRDSGASAGPHQQRHPRPQRHETQQRDRAANQRGTTAIHHVDRHHSDPNQRQAQQGQPGDGQPVCPDTNWLRRRWRNSNRCMATGETSAIVAAIEQVTVAT
jgi:hypothetical protein